MYASFCVISNFALKYVILLGKSKVKWMGCDWVAHSLG